MVDLEELRTEGRRAAEKLRIGHYALEAADEIERLRAHPTEEEVARVIMSTPAFADFMSSPHACAIDMARAVLALFPKVEGK